MDITMVKANRRYCCTALYSILSIAPIVIIPQAEAAESRFSPGVNSSLYAYQIERDTLAAEDEGAAWEISPYLNWSRSSTHLETTLRWQHDRVYYRDDDRAQRQYNNFDLDHETFLFDKRLIWSLSANQSYRIRDTRNGIFADRITAAETLSRARSFSSQLSYKNPSTAKYRIEADAAIQRLRLGAPAVDDGLGEIKTEAYAGRWLLASNQRATNFYWQYNGQVQETERTNGFDISTRIQQGLIGIPFAPKFSVIGRAGTERADNGNQYVNQYDYFGAGVEFRFGALSRVNITMNRSDSSKANEKNETSTYAASEFLFAPSRRTRLEGSFDRRYFGRTLELNGRYDIRFLSIRLSLKDEVRVQNLLDLEQTELGLFVCPEGANDLAGCFRPPTSQYVPVFGEQFQQITTFNTELREELIELRNFGFSLAYNRSRLLLGLTLRDLETVYVERADSNRSRSAGLQASWQLDSNSKLLANADYYRVNYFSDNRSDDNLSISVGYDVQLSPKANARLTVRRLDRNSNIAEFTNSENRVWLEFRYSFN